MSNKRSYSRVFYVNPMSYSNLALYDYSLLSNIGDLDLYYYCNTKYDQGVITTKTNKIYNYSDKTGFFKILSYLKSQFTLLKAVRSKAPEIVHFQWLKIHQVDYILLKLLKKLGIKTVLTAHNILPHGTGVKNMKSYKKIYSIVTAIIVHAENTRTELSESLNIDLRKIHVIPHGIFDLGKNVDSEKVDSYIEKFRTQLELDKKVVFSALGTINDYKGIDLIVDVWKNETISKNNDIHLIIAGKGYHEKLVELNDMGNVSLLNRFLLEEEFLALLKLTDFVLLPYKKISQSGILLSAINEKKRVIVSDVGGLKDPFKFGEIGYVLSDLNHIELNKAITMATFNNSVLPDEKIWHKIFKYYDWKDIGLKTNELYNSLP